MITIKTDQEIKILREGGKKLASIMKKLAKMVRPGISSLELDEMAEKLITKIGGRPSFKNYQTRDDSIPYPASLCVSLNSEVVHGIPKRDVILKNGDLVKLDLGMEYKKMYTDMAITVPCGRVSRESKLLSESTKKCLEAGIKAVKEGMFIGDIGFAIQSSAEKKGFSVVKKLVGHGVGYKPHEAPEVPNFGEKQSGERLKAGMVLAIEPMVNAGKDDVFLAEDEWTWKTSDGSLSAHFEHTIAVTKKGSEILTPFSVF